MAEARPQLTALEGRRRLAKLRPSIEARIDLARAQGRTGGTRTPSRMPGTPPVWVGSAAHAADVPTLQRLGIGAVLNCAPSVCRPPMGGYARAGIAYARVDARDDRRFPLLSRCLAPATKFLSAHAGTGVLVHCMAGCNRSATLAVAHLMLRDRCELLELFAACSAARPSILQNAAFQLQLCELAAAHGLLHDAAPARSAGDYTREPHERDVERARPGRAQRPPPPYQ